MTKFVCNEFSRNFAWICIPDLPSWKLRESGDQSTERRQRRRRGSERHHKTSLCNANSIKFTPHYVQTLLVSKRKLMEPATKRMKLNEPAAAADRPPLPVPTASGGVGSSAIALLKRRLQGPSPKVTSIENNTIQSDVDSVRLFIRFHFSIVLTYQFFGRSQNRRRARAARDALISKSHLIRDEKLGCRPKCPQCHDDMIPVSLPGTDTSPAKDGWSCQRTRSTPWISAEKVSKFDYSQDVPESRRANISVRSLAVREYFLNCITSQTLTMVCFSPFFSLCAQSTLFTGLL